MIAEPAAEDETQIELLELVALKIREGETEEAVADVAVVAGAAADGFCRRDRDAGSPVACEKRCGVLAQFVSLCGTRHLCPETDDERVGVSARRAEPGVRRAAPNCLAPSGHLGLISCLFLF